MSNPNGSFEDYGPMQHANMPLPTAPVHPKHPFRNKENHEKLRRYLSQRLKLGADARDRQLNRFVRIDKNIAGWMQLSDEDKKRDSKKESTGIPQATAINLPLSYVHLDDMMTYFAATFSPTRGMFYHTGKPEEVGAATQIVTLMNNNAIYAGYYREMLLGIYSLLKYNTGGFQVNWSKDVGPKIVAAEDGSTEVQSELKWQGNRLEALDVYNLLRDPLVHPTKLHSEGEFAAQVKLKSFYWLQQAASQGKYFNCKDALDDYRAGRTCGEIRYYKSPPAQASMESDDSGGTNWKAILSMSAGTLSAEGSFELTEIEIRLNPTEFGLVAPGQTGRNRYEVWRFTLLNGEYIIDATYKNNIHGYLSYMMGILNDDLMEQAAKSTAEILQPLQDFASFLMNTHVYATRKNIWGLIAYDPSVLDLGAVPEGEVAARIPMKPEAWGKDIRNAVYEHQSKLETGQTMQDLESVMGIINQFFPTQSLPSQIASIDRAITSQVAAVQQGVNRRQQKAARLMDDTLFRNVRFVMYYNLIQYQPDESQVADFYSGKSVTINLSEMRQTDLPFIVGQGLKAIDRQASAQQLQQIIFALIQAPQAAQGIDLLGLIDYWTSMIDIDLDMTQFEKPVVAEGAQGGTTGQATDAAGNPIQPATNPQSLTSPIYGS